jgi:putative transcriptional regulator
MLKKKNSRKSLAPLKRKAASRQGDTKFGRELIAAAREIAAHRRGEVRLESYSLPASVDVKAIRANTGLSQAQFAGRFGFNARTLQEWEAGRAAPPPPVRAYLMVIERDRGAVERALDRQ